MKFERFQVNAIRCWSNMFSDKLYIDRKTLPTTFIFSSREQFCENIHQVLPLTEVNIAQEVKYLLSIMRFNFEYTFLSSAYTKTTYLPPDGYWSDKYVFSIKGKRGLVEICFSLARRSILSNKDSLRKRCLAPWINVPQCYSS